MHYLKNVIIPILYVQLKQKIRSIQSAIEVVQVEWWALHSFNRNQSLLSAHQRLNTVDYHAYSYITIEQNMFEYVTKNNMPTFLQSNCLCANTLPTP